MTSTALANGTGIPLVIFQVSGLWQYTHLNWQPDSQATTLTPGPSTAEPVVKEWTNPNSPLSSAPRISSSLTFSPRETRKSKGLPISETSGVVAFAFITSGGTVEGSIDHIHLL